MYQRALVFILSDIEDSSSSSHYDLPVRKSILFVFSYSINTGTGYLQEQLAFEVSQFSSSLPPPKSGILMITLPAVDNLSITLTPWTRMG